MVVVSSAFQTLLNICEALEKNNLDYRVTGIPAANFYGYGLWTNVIDIAVDSDESVFEAVRVLGLPEISDSGSYDPYIYYIEGRGYIKIQGDMLGHPVKHPLGFKLHSKDCLLDRLDIYAGSDRGGRIEKAAAFIALTVDMEKTEMYKDIWNRL